MNGGKRQFWMACGVLAIATMVLTRPVGAEIIGGGTFTGNLNVPDDDPGWSNVGIFTGDQSSNQNSAVYLSNGWILTAYHSSPAGYRQPTVRFPGDSTLYSLSNWTRIDGADLEMAHLSSIPSGVHNLDIASAAPADGTFVAGIGYGYKRASSTLKTWWVDTTDPNHYIWYTSFHAGLPTVQGFDYGSAGAENWGYNRINKPSSFATHYDEGYGDTQLIYTVFDKSLFNDSAVGNNVMEVATGDSGGGLFVKNGGTWQLAGTLVYSYGFQDQPGNTADYNNVSGAVNLSYYYNDIRDVLLTPEPCSLVMLVVMVGAWSIFAWWRRG